MVDLSTICRSASSPLGPTLAFCMLASSKRLATKSATLQGLMQQCSTQNYANPDGINNIVILWLMT